MKPDDRHRAAREGSETAARRVGRRRLATVRADFFLDPAERLNEQERALMTAMLNSLVVDIEYLGKPSFMPLFVVLRPGLVLDDTLRAALRQRIRDGLSPRFLPDQIVQVAEVPRTLTGKKQELPVKKLMLGRALAEVVNKDACANPQVFDWYVDYAKSL